MDKNPLYKIVSASAFLVFFAFTIILFSKSDRSDSSLYIYYIGIIVVGFLITVFNFWLISKKNNFMNFFTEEQTETTKEITKKITTEFDEIKQRESLKNVIFELLKDVESYNSIEKLTERLLQNFAETFSIVQGIIFVKKAEDELFHPTSTYAYYSDSKIRPFKIGEGISGQVAKNKKILSISNIPEDYITVLSGLGSSSPNKLLILPLIANNRTIAIIELAAFTNFPENIEEISSEISKPLGEIIESITIS